MAKYWVNNNSDNNPNNDHEVHKDGCHLLPAIVSKTSLGEHNNCSSAVTEAKKIYSNSDGCIHCIPECHKS